MRKFSIATILIAFWKKLFPKRRPATLAELLAKKYPPGHNFGDDPPTK